MKTQNHQIPTWLGFPMVGLIVAANLFSAPIAEAEPTHETRDLIIVAGQSNAVGFDASAAELPADAGDKEVMFWWRCGDPPPDDHDSVNRGWTTLQPQPKSNPMAKKSGVPRQYGNFSNPAGGFGPEIGLARELRSKTKQPLAIVKAAFSGTGMTTDWDHQKAGPEGACYRALVEETKHAIEKAAGQGIKLRLHALVWVQGESDANAKNAPEYGKNLGEMIKTLRADLNAPEMMALIGVNTNFGEGKNKFMPVIVQQQQDLAKNLPHCVYVDTSGVTYANAAHFDTKSTIEIGRRFASALIAADKKAPDASTEVTTKPNIHSIPGVQANKELDAFWTTENTQPVKIPPTMANVHYGEHSKQVLDFWQAKSDKPTPLVFFIHGGSWKTNDKDKVTAVRDYLAAGISVVSINYRFVQEAKAAGIKPPVQWPLHDAARALQFVRSKATEWNIDKTRIAASGGSAGACTSLWLAFHDDLAVPDSKDPIARESTRLLCAGLVGAQTTLDPQQMKEWTPNSTYGGHAFGLDGDKANKVSGFEQFLANRNEIMPWIKEYSPYELVTADDPPVYIYYSVPPSIGKDQKDPTHTSNFGVKLQEKMRSTGVECLVMYPGATGLPYPNPVEFLIARLKNGKTNPNP